MLWFGRSQHDKTKQNNLPCFIDRFPILITISLLFPPTNMNMKMKINFHFMIFILFQMKFDTNINSDELLKTIWDHKKKNGLSLLVKSNTKPKLFWLVLKIKWNYLPTRALTHYVPFEVNKSWLQQLLSMKVFKVWSHAKGFEIIHMLNLKCKCHEFWSICEIILWTLPFRGFHFLQDPSWMNKNPT